jgi:hypothetical protein
MIGNVNTILVAGAMCVTPWNTSSGRPSELRRSWDVSAVNQEISFLCRMNDKLRVVVFIEVPQNPERESSARGFFKPSA